MAFCGTCGTKMEDGAKFCPSCGAQTGAAPQQAQPQQQTYQAQQPQQQTYQQPQQQSYQAQQTPPQQQQQGAFYTPPVVPGAPEQADLNDAQENKTMAILAYFLFFVPLLMGLHKTSPFVKYHTNQGTVLCIAAVAWGIAYSILSFILAFIPVLGWILIVIIGLTGLIFPLFIVLGIMNVVNAKMKPLPLIGGISIIK